MKMLLKYDIVILPLEFFFSIRWPAQLHAITANRARLREQQLTSQRVKWLRLIVANFGRLFRD
jgi:hypothetical protein